MNRAMIIGRLGADPELRYTKSQKAVCDMRIATTERYKDAQGQKQERTDWHSVVCWGGQAEVAGKYLRKGSHVYVSGSLQTKSWDDKDGKKQYKTEIHAQELEFLDTKEPGKSSLPAVSDKPVPPSDDDIPF